APAKRMRREFTVKPGVKSATVHATAMGVYKLMLNGKQVSDERLAPGWSAYQKRIHSRAYDVTGMIRVGRNALAGTLADGWFCGYLAYGLLTDQPGLLDGWPGRNYYGMRSALRVQLEIEYTD